MFDKIRLFIVLAFIFTLIFSSTEAETHYQDTAANFDNHAQIFKPYETVEFDSPKFRCKLCGKTFRSGLVMAGHIRGDHNKWLIHKYYEKL